MDTLSTMSFPTFPLLLSKHGVFSRPVVAGMDEATPLNALVRRIRRALAENNIPFDRKCFFTAHAV